MKNYFLFVMALVLASCSTQKVLKTDTQNDIDLSGRWNSTDAEIATNELFNNLSTSSWLKNYEMQYNLKPQIEVLEFNESFKGGGDMLDEYFKKYVEESPLFKLIEEKSEFKADFRLSGEISAEEFISSNQKYIDYMLKVKLSEANGNPVWEDYTTIKKYIKD